jgi:hypothetical protein
MHMQTKRRRPQSGAVVRTVETDDRLIDFSYEGVAVMPRFGMGRATLA